MKNKKIIAVFPVDEDFLSLSRNRSILLENETFRIQYYITLGGWNINDEKILLYKLDEFDFRKINTIILINSYRKLENAVIDKIISLAKKNGISIINARDDEDISSDLVREKCEDTGINYEYISEETCPVGSKVVDSINIPVVTISGVGPHVEKFKVGLYLQDSFKEMGYKAIYISSRREGKLFDAHIYPEYMYKNNLDYTAKIFEFNSFVNGLIRKEKPDIVLIGVPGEMMMLSEKHCLNFGVMASIVFNAIKPDVAILNMYNMKYNDEFLEEQKLYCKYRFGIIPDLIYATNIGIIDSSLQEAYIQYFYSNNTFNNLLENNTIFSDLDIRSGKFFDRIMKILVEYGSLDVM